MIGQVKGLLTTIRKKRKNKKDLDTNIGDKHKNKRDESTITVTERKDGHSNIWKNRDRHGQTDRHTDKQTNRK